MGRHGLCEGEQSLNCLTLIFVQRRNITGHITLRVKTLHGERTNYSVRVSIYDTVATIGEKLAKIDPNELGSYIGLKIIYPMSKINSLPLD